jgi:cysteine desulfuration protein SufE
MRSVEEIIDLFHDLDRDTKLDLLLDYSKKLPEIPERFQNTEQKETHRVHECQTPVSLWVDLIEGKIQIYADVPKESPTVRGFLSILSEIFNGASPAVVIEAPQDILSRTGLDHTLGMMRLQGLNAIYQRVKSAARMAESPDRN